MKADILCCWGNSWLDKIIQWALRTKITHIVVKIDEDFVMESSWFGVKLSRVGRLGNSYIQLRQPDITDEQKDKVVYFIKSSVDTPYDYKQFFGIGINRLFGIKLDYEDAQKYICVELALEAYRSIGIELLPDIADEDIIPSDLLLSKELIRVN